MGQAIGQSLAFAVGIALSPIPIIAVVLMLSTPKARVNGLAFLGGWIVGLALAGTLVLLAASGDDASDAGGPAEWVSIVKLALGLLLIALAVKQWRGRPRGREEPEMPEWMKAVDTFSAGKAAGLAALLAVNPKNLILIVGGCAAIAQTGAGTGGQAGALAVFVAVASLGAAVPVGIHLSMGDRAGRILGELHNWMARESSTIMAVICLIIGAKLIGDAITALSG